MIDIQVDSHEQVPFPKRLMRQWAKVALFPNYSKCPLTIRLVDETEIQRLNDSFRHQNKPTNVLAFPSALPKEVKKYYPLLGDVIICPAVIVEESRLQNKTLAHHWAHITIHGILHLLGYDHELDEETQKMQAKEIELLHQLGFDNPYDSEKYRLD